MHRTEYEHVHHTHWLWWFDLSLLLLALAALALTYPLVRLPRKSQPVFAGSLAALLVALAVGAFAAGIDPRSGPGTYHRDSPQVERLDDGGTEVIVRKIEIHHDHPPIDVAAHWILLGLGLSALAIPGARTAVRAAYRRPAKLRAAQGGSGKA